MLRGLVCSCLLWLAGTVSAQMWDVAAESAKVETDITDFPTPFTPPHDWRNWTPSVAQFNLYVNSDGRSGDTMPRIDILDGYHASWPFIMQYTGDTVYLYIAPPGYSLSERSSVDSLPEAFPIVFLAGTERAVYWFQYDSGQVTLDPLQPAEFLAVISVSRLPDSIQLIQIPLSGRIAKSISEILRETRGYADLVQLDDGFYENYWYRVRKKTVRRWKVNESALGVLLFLRPRSATAIPMLRDVLATYRVGAN